MEFEGPSIYIVLTLSRPATLEPSIAARRKGRRSAVVSCRSLSSLGLDANAADSAGLLRPGRHIRKPWR